MTSDSISEELAIVARGLVKRFGEDVLAVDSVNLTIPKNTIYALLGPNGAGKTTTIHMLTTLLQPTEGTASVAGCDIRSQANEVRNRIGVTFQEMVLDDELTGRQVLVYHSRLYRQSNAARETKIREVLSLVELEEAADRRAKTYSGGMKRRLELARALMTDPEVLFLDEPTLGLDPQTRARVWDYLRGLKEKRGITLLLTTHYMDEAEALAIASQTDNPGAYHSMIMIFNLPMLFLSNALYPLGALPLWMKVGASINPTSYVIDGVRLMMFKDGATLAGGAALPLWLCWIVVLAFATMGMWMAYAAFNKSIRS